MSEVLNSEQIVCSACGKFLVLSFVRKKYLDSCGCNTELLPIGILNAHIYPKNKEFIEDELIIRIDHPSFCKACLSELSLRWNVYECGCGG